MRIALMVSADSVHSDPLKEVFLNMTTLVGLYVLFIRQHNRKTCSQSAKTFFFAVVL